VKKLVFLILVLSLAGIGASYAETDATKSSNFFLGTKSSAANLNQVLALLVGPQGVPGAVGVAGKDGLIGMNGEAGLPGAPGATGVNGKDGTGVLTVAFTGAQGDCESGGTKFLDGSGNTTFACNGAAGATGAAGVAGVAGATGATGAAGTTGAAGVAGVAGATGATGVAGATGAAGTGTGGDLSYGAGQISVGACETDGIIKLGLSRTFTGTDFVFNELTLGEFGSTNDLKATCAEKVVSFYVKIIATTLKNTTGEYLANDLIKCTVTLPAAAGWPASVPQFSFNSSQLLCSVPAAVGTQRATPAYFFNKINTADYTDTIGLEIG